jgi:hypothetical protein
MSAHLDRRGDVTLPKCKEDAAAADDRTVCSGVSSCSAKTVRDHSPHMKFEMRADCLRWLSTKGTAKALAGLLYGDMIMMEKNSEPSRRVRLPDWGTATICTGLMPASMINHPSANRA